MTVAEEFQYKGRTDFEREIERLRHENAHLRASAESLANDYVETMAELHRENERLRATIARVEAKALEELGKGPADDFGLGRKDAMRDVRMVLQLRTGMA